MKKTTMLVLCLAAALVRDASAGEAAPVASAGGEKPAAVASGTGDFFDPPGPEKTTMPKKGEWEKSGSFAHGARPFPKRCSMTRVREWMKVHCDVSQGTALLVAGSRDGVFLWGGNDGAEIIFPLRRGDRRVFEIESADTMGMGPYGAGGRSASPTTIIQEEWIEGEAEPIVLIE